MPKTTLKRSLRSSEIKWHFVQNESGKVFLFKTNGPMKKEDKELGEIVSITTSRTDEKDEKLKVECANGFIGLHVHMFDFTKNSFSQLFKSSCFSALQFVQRFDEVVWKKEHSRLPEDPDVLDDDISVVTGTDAECNQRLIKTAKRPIPEMESPPVPKKKRQKKVLMKGKVKRKVTAQTQHSCRKWTNTPCLIS